MRLQPCYTEAAIFSSYAAGRWRKQTITKEETVIAPPTFSSNWPTCLDLAQPVCGKSWAPTWKPTTLPTARMPGISTHLWRIQVYCCIFATTDTWKPALKCVNQWFCWTTTHNAASVPFMNTYGNQENNLDATAAKQMMMAADTTNLIFSQDQDRIRALNSTIIPPEWFW